LALRGNKESFTVEGDFPVQNGKANFTLTVTASFQPNCTPPMSVLFSDVEVCDVTNNICQTFPRHVLARVSSVTCRSVVQARRGG
jgi:hypothetical protein